MRGKIEPACTPRNKSPGRGPNWVNNSQIPAVVRRNFFGSDKAAGVDAAFQFLQACEFGFPRAISAVEALILHARRESGIEYGAYIVGLENWFRPRWMKELDEAGIPLPLAERLSSRLAQPETRGAAIEQIKQLDLDLNP